MGMRDREHRLEDIHRDSTIPDHIKTLCSNLVIEVDHLMGSILTAIELTYRRGVTKETRKRKLEPRGKKHVSKKSK